MSSADTIPAMPGKVRTPAFAQYLVRVGRPLTTKREIKRAHRLAEAGLGPAEIARCLGRVRSTAWQMLRKDSAPCPERQRLYRQARPTALAYQARYNAEHRDQRHQYYLANKERVLENQRRRRALKRHQLSRAA